MKEKITRNIKFTQNIMDIVLVIYAIVAFIIKDQYSNLLMPITVSFLMILIFISYFSFGYRRNKLNKIKLRINNTFIVTSTVYLMSIYLIGTATGFNENKINILSFILLLAYVFLLEIFRYMFVSKCYKASKQAYYIAFITTIMDILILSNFSPLNALELPDLFTIVVTSGIKNSLLTYTSLKFGYVPCLIYAFVLTFMPKESPIYPKMGNYITLVFQVTYAAVLFYNISKPVRRNEEESLNTYNKSFNFYFERIMLIVVILAIFLVSGNFKYRISAIASDSMYPNLKRGDAIILEKLDDKNRDTLAKNMIVAFYQDDQIVTHRILEIQNEDGEENIITKGDNNSTKDVTKKTKDDIIGIVRFRIPYLGYPSVEISEIKNK